MDLLFVRFGFRQKSKTKYINKSPVRRLALLIGQNGPGGGTKEIKNRKSFIMVVLIIWARYLTKLYLQNAELECTSSKLCGLSVIKVLSARRPVLRYKALQFCQSVQLTTYCITFD